MTVINKVLLAIDPGVAGCGVAGFFDGNLGFAEYVQSAAHGSFLRRFSLMLQVHDPQVKIVIEKPQIYQQRLWKGDPNDLVSETLAGGMFVGKILWELRHFGRGFPHACSAAYDETDAATVQAIFPFEWKRQVKGKKITTERAKKHLKETEIKYISLPGKTLAHNVWDAVGIGLVMTGRCSPGVETKR